MVNYKNAKVYEIVSKKTKKKYIGTTTQTLEKRLSTHLRHLREYKLGNYNYVSANEILKHGDAKIKLIQKVPVKNVQELHKKEGKYHKLYKGKLVNIRTET
jgi:hypothetical protein